MVLDEAAEIVRAAPRRAHLPHASRLRLRQRRRRRLQRGRRGRASSCCRWTPTPRPGAARAPAERPASAPAVVITDSFGRAWRRGQCEIAIGRRGPDAVDDWPGRVDADGRELRATAIAIADEAAAAADLARAKDSREPAVVVRGLERLVTADDGPGAVALVRAAEEDLFA